MRGFYSPLVILQLVVQLFLASSLCFCKIRYGSFITSLCQVCQEFVYMFPSRALRVQFSAWVCSPLSQIRFCSFVCFVGARLWYVRRVDFRNTRACMFVGCCTRGSILRLGITLVHASFFWSFYCIFGYQLSFSA